MHASLERNKQKISKRIQLRKHVRACSMPGIVDKAGVNETWSLPSRRSWEKEDTSVHEISWINNEIEGMEVL